MTERLLHTGLPQVRIAAGRVDWALVGVAATLLLMGLVMVASSSVAVAERETGSAFALLYRQGLYTVLGLGVAAGTRPLRTAGTTYQLQPICSQKPFRMRL